MMFKVPNTDYYREGTGMVCELCEERLENPEDVYALCSLDGEYIVTLCKHHFELASFLRENTVSKMRDYELI